MSLLMERLHKVWIVHCWSSSNPNRRNDTASSKPIATCCPEHPLVHTPHLKPKVRCSCCLASSLPPSQNFHDNGNGSVPLSGNLSRGWQTSDIFLPSLIPRASSSRSTSHSVCLSSRRSAKCASIAFLLKKVLRPSYILGMPRRSQRPHIALRPILYFSMISRRV